MGTTNPLRRFALAAALTTTLGGCGGGSSPSSPTPTPTPAPTTPPPVVVLQATGSVVKSGFVNWINFTTTRAGAIDATVDWTFTTNDVDVVITRGSCNYDQLAANQCNIAGFSVSETAKPEKVTLASTEAGTYTLFVENTGDKDESVSYQVVLQPMATGATGPQASSRTVRANPFGRKGAILGHGQMD